MVVVSDSSVLIHLAVVGRLGLLKRKFGEVMVPQAVWREVVIEGMGKPGAKEVDQCRWIAVEEAKDKLLVRSLAQHLDEGESEAIALALEVDADLVLLDERDARETAESFGLDILGMLGLLIWAKREQLIPCLREEIARLKQAAGFRISEALYRRVLVEVGETG